LDSPAYLEGINTKEREESYATITRGGNLYFVGQFFADSTSGYSIFHSKFDGEKAIGRKKIFEMEHPYEVGDPWVSPDHAFMILTRYNKNNWGSSCDLYLSKRTDLGWSKPVELKELNSTGPDFSPYVTNDLRWIYYRKNYQMKRVAFKGILMNYLN